MADNHFKFQTLLLLIDFFSLYKIFCLLKTPTRTWTCTRYIVQMSYLYASDFPLKNFSTLAQYVETTRKKDVWEKSNEAYSLSTWIQITGQDKPNSIFTFLCFFFYTISTSKEMFFFQRASCKKHWAAHWRKNHGLDLLIFDWLVLSMRMQVILDSIFARTGSALKGAGRKESSGTGLVHFWLPVY